MMLQKHKIRYNSELYFFFRKLNVCLGDKHLVPQMFFVKIQRIKILNIHVHIYALFMHKFAWNEIVSYY